MYLFTYGRNRYSITYLFGFSFTALPQSQTYIPVRLQRQAKTVSWNYSRQYPGNLHLYFAVTHFFKVFPQNLKIRCMKMNVMVNLSPSPNSLILGLNQMCFFFFFKHKINQWAINTVQVCWWEVNVKVLQVFVLFFVCFVSFANCSLHTYVCGPCN